MLLTKILVAYFFSWVPSLTAAFLIHPRYHEFQTCTSIFLDLGANLGVQARRLYEQEKFPRQGVLNSLFDQHFGTSINRTHAVCTFAFEPNPRHAPRLREMEAVYQSLGYRYYFFPYAVSTLDTKFQLSKPNSETQMGASLEKKSPASASSSSVTVQVINFLTFLRKILDPKKKDKSKKKEQEHRGVLCKMDIEGEEYNLLPALISSGLICLIDTITVEYHLGRSSSFRSGFLASYERAQLAEFQSNVSKYISLYRPPQSKSTSCDTAVMRADDELYHDDNLLTNPLPLFQGASEECRRANSDISSRCILSEPVEGMSVEQYKETIFGVKMWA
jgi:hypothetical protein